MDCPVEARYAAESPVEIAGCRGTVMACVLEADNSAVLRRGPLEALGAQMGSRCDMLTLRNRGADISLKVNQVGHHVLCVVALGGGSSRTGRGTKFAATHLLWASASKRLNLSNC